MDLTIGFLPEKYYKNEPSTGGYNFYVHKGVKYALNVGEMYYPHYTNEQLAQFIESLVPFPLYFLFDQREKDIKEQLEKYLDEDQLTFEILHESKSRKFYLVTITNHDELINLLPIMVWQHNCRMSSLWSTNRNAFTIENKTWDSRSKYMNKTVEETVCLNFNEPTTVFWLGHDFHGTDIFSNEDIFAKLENVQKLLTFKTDIIEFG